MIRDRGIFEPYRDVTLADVDDTLKRIERDGAGIVEVIHELQTIRGRLENVEDLLATIDKRGGGIGGWGIIISILLGLILWRVW
jgi:hypothetical protein